MSTSSQLTDQQRASILAGHRSFRRRKMVRYWSLSERDVAFVNERRRQQNRLGFAVQLCLPRYPGWPLKPGELPPENLPQYVSAQLAVDPIEIECVKKSVVGRGMAFEINVDSRLPNSHLRWKPSVSIGQKPG